MHFITTYSTYFAQELAATSLDRFECADTAENRRLLDQGKDEDCLLAYRTKGEYWSKERTVIVAYTPSSARKQAYTFDDKLESMRRELLAMRAKVRDNSPHWRKEAAVRERYIRFCEQIHMAPQLYELKFEQSHYVLSLKKGSRTPMRRIETPSKTQSEVLSAFGYHVDDSGVLQGPAG